MTTDVEKRGWKDAPNGEYRRRTAWHRINDWNKFIEGYQDEELRKRLKEAIKEWPSVNHRFGVQLEQWLDRKITGWRAGAREKQKPAEQLDMF